MHNSFKRLLNNIIEYATEGNDITVKTHNFILSAIENDSQMSWIVSYKKMKIHLIAETGETHIVFQTITTFINDGDKEVDDEDNS